MIIHVVQNGDTLYSIGRRYGVTIEQLISANGETVQPSLVIGQAVIIPVPTEKQGDVYVNGYAYPNISDEALGSALPYLTMITPFSYGIRTDGTLVPLDDARIISAAENAGVRPLLLITTLTDEGRFSSDNAAAVLSDSRLTQTLADNIIAKLQSADYFGVDIDFEYIPPEYRDAYTSFISLLRAMAGPLGYRVLVAVAPKTEAAQRGLLYESHDYGGLGAAADFVLVMTYEWGYTYGPPLAVAPIDKVGEVLRYAVTEIPSGKILMGIPNYAYDWQLPYVRGTAAQSLSNNSAIERARQYGAEIQFDETAKTPFYYYYDEGGNQHVVWFEDARSYSAKFELLSELSLAGMSIWNLSSFYKPLMTTIDETFGIIKL